MLNSDMELLQKKVVVACKEVKVNFKESYFWLLLVKQPWITCKEGCKEQ